MLIMQIAFKHFIKIEGMQDFIKKGYQLYIKFFDWITYNKFRKDVE